ncbi:MAG: anhydro-N-acetylmuramic acid kinase [Candidatus Abyssobacteria bacterium SURF_17]|jgi:anhydro-N-acetylmuramic acid kinase|uniref:Anhydro-N-acetylmuramic acid kinase n=1 Tax=Candidatus Abyssobacteria bacterium SURF_17 TaxID=2093361 RepID=A0A419EYB0_9BACT|nr:MAG: anhydro-N-acetylmuramic acid kinase [Candidatus Abyssubacteria bacterium SURF_17]
MKRLLEIARLDKKLVVGLMSGTSADGVDAALVEITGNYLDTRVKLIAFETVPYPVDIANAVRNLQNGRTRQVCEMNFRLGELFAEAALGVIRKADLSSADVHLIGSHGQTIFHLPEAMPPDRSTLQVAEPCVIAERTGVVTVADFRTRDVAAGGYGAPLIPYVDFLLFRDTERVRACQNIGGIANVTVVTPSLDGVFAFDTGPGNMLIDEFVRAMTRGEKQFDDGGTLARSGKVEEEILRNLLEHPYFALPPPKTTGRELFGAELVRTLLSATPPEHCADMLATVTGLTAHSIQMAYERFVFPKTRIDEIILSGGGCRNDYLIELIRALFAPIEVRTSDDYGIPADAKEAVGFAILANETISGNPSNIPTATGARRPVVLGKIVP